MQKYKEKVYVVKRCDEGELEAFLNTGVEECYDVISVASKRDFLGRHGWVVVARRKSAQ